jgi:hypothetical protein
MIAVPLVSRVSSNPLAPRATEKRWLSANLRARRGEKRRKRPSRRLKRNVSMKPESKKAASRAATSRKQFNSEQVCGFFSCGTCLYV